MTRVSAAQLVAAGAGASQARAARQARRHEVRPGVTGLAQVKGRNAMPWAERLAWDVRYVETRSFALDCRIVLDTFKVVLAREGITEEGQVAMTDFEGAPDVEV